MTRSDSKTTRVVLAMAFAIAVLAAPVASAGDFQSQAQERAARTHWQNKYRGLLIEAERLRAVIGEESELYANANRRNYRRGSVRHGHRKAALEAERQLAEVKAQLAAIEDDARRAGARPGWLRQVELEFEDAARRPTVTAGPGAEGRNPLHLEQNDAED